MSTITLPNNLQNGDVGDADKVMGNLNAIVTRYNADVGGASGDLIDESSTQTLGGKTLTKPILDGSVQNITAASPIASSTYTINLASANVFTITMPAGDLTLAVSNASAGQFFCLEIVNTTSQGTLNWFSTLKWVGGTTPTLTGTNGKKDTFMFRVTGTGTYDAYIVGMNI